MDSNDNLTSWWEAKYKTCRAAFIAMGRINRQNDRNEIKLLQRVQQLAFDGLNAPTVQEKQDALARIRLTLLEHLQERAS